MPRVSDPHGLLGSRAVGACAVYSIRSRMLDVVTAEPLRVLLSGLLELLSAESPLELLNGNRNLSGVAVGDPSVLLSRGLSGVDDSGPTTLLSPFRGLLPLGVCHSPVEEQIGRLDVAEGAVEFIVEECEQIGQIDLLTISFLFIGTDIQDS